MSAKHYRHRMTLPAALLALSTMTALPAWSAGPVRTAPGYITVMEAGWAADTVSIELTSPIVNPAGCPAAVYGYVTRTDDPGRALYHDILREAWLHHSKVELLISGEANDCPYTKPRIISVKVTSP